MTQIDMIGMILILFFSSLILNGHTCPLILAFFCSYVS